jgi:Ca2+-binding EF-hand superfamily protein
MIIRFLGCETPAAYCSVLLLTILIGCKQQVANKPPPNVIDETSSIESDEAAPLVINDATEPAIVNQPSTTESASDNASSLDDTSLPSASDNKVLTPMVDDRDQQVAIVDCPPSERFLLLTRDGPLVVDVVLRVDNAPYTNALEQLVDRVMQELNDDQEDATWEAMLDNPKFAYGQFGNLIPDDEEQRIQLIEMYDTNRNRIVDHDELPRFLTRNVGGSRSFSLRSSNEFRSTNRTRSPVRRLLDADHNGAITTDEMQAAPSRLFDRDADDDEIVTLADMKNTVARAQPQMSNQRRVNSPDTAISISPRTRWGYVSYALQETYAYGERVAADDIPLTPEVVELLDENGNQLIDNNEVKTLADIPAHLVLEVAFFNPVDTESPASPTIQIISTSDSLASSLDARSQHSNRVSFDLPGADVTFFVNEDPSLTNRSQTVSAQFSMLDADGNGYIDADEYSGQLLGISIPFESIDRDGNGMISEKEVGDLIEQRQAVVRSQIRARAADQEDALFTALDTNSDGRLTAREIQGAPDVLKRLDRNKDKQLQSHEIPGTMAVGFIRGNAQQDNTLFAMPAVTSRGDKESSPRWFLGMDSNADGDISPREFLGSTDQFRELDANRDGFVSADEVREL